MPSLADSEKLLLLAIARRSLTAAVEHTSESQELCHDPVLVRPGGAFVTLLKKGRLRGCIGQLPAGLPLGQVVAQCAHAVASEDPRFSPLQHDELASVDIEISVLSEPYEIRPEEIDPGTHGLIVSRGMQRGVLLPQVASQLSWNRIRFLERTCEKAGLNRHSWKQPETRIQAFTAVVFSESSVPAAGAAAGTPSDYSSST